MGKYDSIHFNKEYLDLAEWNMYEYEKETVSKDKFIKLNYLDDK